MNMTGIALAPEDRTVIVNEDALKAWYETEWARQIRLAEVGVMAFDVIRSAKIHGTVPDVVFRTVKQKIEEVNALLLDYTDVIVDFPEMVSPDALENARSVAADMDLLERAAYDKASIEYIMRVQFTALAKPTPFAMLSFAITNHMWRKFGGKSIYQKWANPVRDYGNMCKDLEKIKGAIYRHLLTMLTLRYRGTDPFTGEPITPPAEFYIVE